MNVLICYDGMKMVVEGKTPYLTLNLRLDESVTHELMDVYETENPSLIGVLRTRLEEISPDVIVVIGESDEYRWLATVVCRVYGQFSSWRHQFDKPIGKTSLKIGNKTVTVYALSSLFQLEKLHEIQN